MTLKTARRIFREKFNAKQALDHAMGIMYTDAVTAAPAGSAEARGRTMEYLSTEEYKIQTSAKWKEAAEVLWEHRDELSEIERREAELFRRENEFVAAIPQDEYVAYTILLNKAEAVWHKAKAENDFAAFAPYLRQIFETNIRFDKYYKPDMAPYDVQLDRFERGLTMEKADAFFAALRERIVPLLREVMAKPRIDDSWLKDKVFPVYQQKQFSEYLMKVITIDPNRCTLGETEHPFTCGFNKTDVRITTHYHEDAVLSSMYSVIHEGGHALYEMSGADELENTLCRGGVSMGIHESQSRFFENLIGRSRPFIELIFPEMQKFFPEQLKDVTAGQLYEAANKAQPSLIRTEADELTYALHVMVRYEIEKSLFAGEIDVDDLPKVWNAKYKEYLGIDVPSDREGCLQDSHWAGGNVGYFPSYALGSAYGAQMMSEMLETVDVESAIRSGDLTPITAWLTDRIWKYGSLKDPSEVLDICLGEPFDPKYFTDYLERKYTDLYGLSRKG